MICILCAESESSAFMTRSANKLLESHKIVGYEVPIGLGIIGFVPGVLLIHGSGIFDKNETLGLILKDGLKPPFWQIAQYLSERGFAVMRYDKRGVGANFTTNQKIWGNVQSMISSVMRRKL